jgi:hypothetical protein
MAKWVRQIVFGGVDAMFASAAVVEAALKKVPGVTGLDFGSVKGEGWYCEATIK